MQKTALILFAHGARDPVWASPLNRVCAEVRAHALGVRVEQAFLEFMSPSLPNCVESLVGEGFNKLVVIPMFLAQGGHLKRDLPLLLESLRTRYPSAAIELSGAIGEVESVVQAMAAHALTLLEDKAGQKLNLS